MFKHRRFHQSQISAEELPKAVPTRHWCHQRFDMDHNKIFTLATLLDPRYKQQFFETEDLITIRSQFLLESLKNSMSDDDIDSGKDDLESTSTDENNIETATHRNF
ncbi:hypothetical protein EVAR_68860_1 [Eumeta japonica]|uniref:Zinc finger BED domain-containing protein 4 n=1 Tax=Eumeta variegata TaxID=151549 RepID=A0A4C1ZBU8_EUMVA|nr:hypothetical protein EVAR_68860_1 [Eumeta japonica]